MAFTLACAPLLAACAARAYAGISFAPGAAEPDVQALARRAQAGDKQAQLELGIRYEEGRGLVRNLDRAARLYADAARTDSLARLVYIPAAGSQGRAMTVPVSSGAVVPGLPEARRRLERLAARQTGAETSPMSAAAIPDGGVAGPLPIPGSVAAEAFADIIILDFAYARCRRVGDEQAGQYGNSPSLAMRACFHATTLPADCRQYRRSLERAAELVAMREGLAALAPTAVDFLNACPERAPAPPPAETGRTESSLTVVEWLLGRTAPPDRQAGDIRREPLSHMYLPELCPAIIEGRIRNFRTSEMLLCADPGEPDGATEGSRAIIRRLLMNGERS